jgi:cytidylate kinase
MSQSFVIAIDGPAAAGKGTLARRLAARFGFAYLDTGALYRAVARDVLAAGADPADAAAAAAAAAALDEQSLADPRLRDPEVAAASSKVAVHPDVRQALLDLQRRFAATPRGAVLDGRDIGTIVCQDADLKLFVTASAETRAHRRWLELQGSGVSESAVLADLIARDERDRNRSTAPLKPAPDAVVLDTSDLSADAVLDAAIALVAPLLTPLRSIGEHTDRTRGVGG